MPSNTANKKRKNKKEPQDKADDKSAEFKDEDSKRDESAFDMDEALKIFEEKYKEITALSGYTQYPSTSSSNKRTGTAEWKRVSEMLSKALEKRGKK